MPEISKFTRRNDKDRQEKKRLVNLYTMYALIHHFTINFSTQMVFDTWKTSMTSLCNTMYLVCMVRALKTT